ncbi:MAG TPA: DUF2238 domain-containing protein [Actinokineospora sp.]|jgi:putative membrane protein|nr:DUF2238 domain-containing protein [Actinokineospora sp.]
MGTLRWTALGVFAAVAIATWWAPRWPAEQALHGSLTVIGLALLLSFWRRLPARSFVLVLTFLTLHTIAARWLYSFVPYDDWTDSLLGFRLSETFGWQRNHFDRLVHFAYGVCAASVLFAYFRENRGWRPRFAALVSVEVVLSTSAVYELFEWVIAVLLSPEAAEAYNGQQGDIWDAHADMALALGGAMIASVVSWMRARP